MLRLLFISFFLISTTASICLSEEVIPKKRGPVVITSETLTAEAGRAVFEGNVLAKTDDITLRAKRMYVYYKDGNKVNKIEAEGDVRVVRGQRVLTSERGEFLAEENKIILTGEPKAIEGENIVTGTKIIYLIEENRSIVENSKVFLKRAQ